MTRFINLIYCLVKTCLFFFLFINLVKKKRKKSNHIWFKPKFENARERQRNTISLNCLVWIWFCKKFDQVLFWRQVNIYIWEKNYWRDHPAVGTIFWLTELVKYKKKDWLYFLISFFLFFFLALNEKSNFSLWANKQYWWRLSQQLFPCGIITGNTQ